MALDNLALPAWKNVTTLHAAILVAPIVLYLFWQPFPDPEKLIIHPSISSRPENTPLKRFKELYPEDYFDGGAYADLPFGKTRYYLVGPEGAPKVVLICGLVTPSPVWAAILPHLSKNFRVLLYDHYGRGYTESPETEYTDMLYITQLALLMQHIGWNKAHIVGVSMGGGIAAAFAAKFPNLLSGKLAIIAPAGLMKTHHFGFKGTLLAHPLMEFISTSPPIRWYLARKPLLPTLNKPSYHQLALMAQLQQVLLPYHISAIGSTVRTGPLRGQEDAYAKLGANKDVDVLVFWGTADVIVPYELASVLLQLVPGAKLITIAGGGHDISNIHADQIGNQIRDFLLA